MRKPPIPLDGFLFLWGRALKVQSSKQLRISGHNDSR